MASIIFKEGWQLLPNGFALPESEFPADKPAKHLRWVKDVAITPWAWRLHGDALEVVEVFFPGGRPDFGCMCHRPEDQPQSAPPTD